MKRQAVYFLAPGVVDIREDEAPEPSSRELLIASEVSAVSAGTELLVYRGQFPAGMAVDETIDALSGGFEYPLPYGYAVVGRVVAAGTDVDEVWVGRRVFAFQPHASHFTARPEEVVPLPDDIQSEAAVFLPNVETAVSFLMDGRPIVGEQVAVLGQGVVGLLTVALLARQPLASLVTLDAHELRREWSRVLGATASFDPAGPLVPARVALQGVRAYPGADLVYELSGNPAALDLAIALAGYNGRIVVGSWYGEKRYAPDLGGRFHRSHMTLTSSQVSHIAPEWTGRWDKPRRLGVAWDMIRAIDPQRLITHRLPASQAGKAYELLDQQPGDALQVIFTY